MGVFTLLLILFAPQVFARNTIVHLFEWKFSDIAKECENFLGPKGFDAVQVSPVNEYAVLPGRPWWERYQPFSYRIKSRSGDEQGFSDMCKRCWNAGVKIYVDVVLNHMSANQPANTVGTAGSPAITTEKYYPSVPYSNENFHSTCDVNNFQDKNNVKNCELDHLHDLDQRQEYVRGKIVNYLNRLISLGASGFRVDAAKHMWTMDLRVIFSRLNNIQTGGRPFIYQEVSDFGGEAVKHETYMPLGHVTEFKNGRQLSRCFRGQNPLKWLWNYGSDWGLMASDSALVFIDDHDTQRSDGSVLNYKTPRNYKMAVAFMLSWPYGTTRVISSFEFNDINQGPPHNEDMTIKDVGFNPDGSCTNGWVCEHRWNSTYGMVGWANVVYGYGVSNFWSNGNNQISYCRGNKGFIAFNIESYDMNVVRQTCMPQGMYCDVASGELKDKTCTGKMILVQADGTAQIEITSNGEGFVAIHANSKID